MRTLMLAALASLAFGCVPKKDLPVEEIAKLTKLEDVMHAQATIADPQMKKAGASSYADADWAGFSDAGARLQATAKKTKEFTKGPEFDGLADRLAGQALALATSAASKDVPSTSKILGEMKQTCKECHKKFR